MIKTLQRAAIPAIVLLVLHLTNTTAFAQGFPDVLPPDMPTEVMEPVDPSAVATEPAVTGPAPEETAVIEDPTEAPSVTTSGVTNAAGQDLISITLDDVALVDVVKMFTRISGANIIATSSNLEGTVTVNLTNVEWKPALSSILDMHDLALIEKVPGTQVYSIVPHGADAPEPMIVKTIFLDYTTVDEVQSVIQPILMSGGSLSLFPSRNALVVQTTASNQEEIRALIKEVDIPGQQVCIETKFMELSDSASKQLGIRWDSLSEFGVRFAAGPFESSKSTTSDRGKNEGISRYNRIEDRSTLNELYDVYNDQYEVSEIEIVELPDGGVLLNENLAPTYEVLNTFSEGQDITSDLVDSFARNISESQAAILSMDSLNIVLSALRETEGVSVVANPKIIVANGATNAFFSVGEREPIIKTEVTRGTTDSPGDQVTASLDTTINTDHIKDGYLETGIDLRVSPVVKTADLIQAEIVPSLKRKTGTKVVGDNSWPIISVKEIRTRFTLESGQTVAIGGLTNTRDSKQVTKVPLLGSIPIIGRYLFTHTKDVKTQDETIIFVTLSLAQPEELYEERGIPDESRLVHRRMIQSKASKHEFDNELRETLEDLEPMTAPEEAPIVEPAMGSQSE